MTSLSLPLRRPRPVGILLASLLIAAGSLLAGTSGLGGRTTAPAPVVPEAQVPVPIPGAGTAAAPVASLDQLDHNIAAWTANLQANPNDFISATTLGTLYHARARLTADLADHERALAAARTAIAIAPGQPGARLLEAAVLFSLHDFGGALAASDELYLEDPRQLGALATRADAEIELGELDAARADLAALDVAADGPAVEIRLARLAAVSGDLAGALALARSARDAAVAAGASDAAFYEYALAEYARTAGDSATARDGYEAALAARSTDLGALLGMARLQAFDGDLDGAITTLGTATAIAPTPEAEALLGDILTLRAADLPRSASDRAADASAAATAYGTVRLTRTLSTLAGAVYDRQLLLFELDHDPASEAALGAAEAALAVRADAPGMDLVAWALHRLGRDEEAWTASLAARATGAAEARILYHAGVIAAALGDHAAARDLLGRALALGPALDPAERDAANTALDGVDAASMSPG